MELFPAPNGWICKSDPGEPGLGVPRWSVNATEARILGELFRGMFVLEIGTGLGVATRAIAERAKLVYTVDIDPWVKESVELPENAVFFSDISEIKGKVMDGAFIDSLHSTAQVEIDTLHAKRLVKKGGIIVYHDAIMQSVMIAIQTLHPVLINTGAGIAITWNDKE
jgi:tRNA G37 N-methylase Trm5